MVAIRVIVEKSILVPYTDEGEALHYIKIDTLDYTIDQISQEISNKIWDWARKYHISVNAFDELGEILDEINIR
jgi:predicted nucleic acid-binding protein